ncbi:WG repeat-containing protein [Runella rosea]|nr:WG repeat-containing protein [Runella rosea]
MKKKLKRIFSRNHIELPMCIRFIFFLASIYIMGSGFVFGQSKRVITKSDEKIIRDKALEVIRSLESDYNAILTSTSDDRKRIQENLVSPIFEARKFVNDSVIIENDFAIEELADLPPDKRDILVEKYFRDLAVAFGLSDNGDEPNANKKVTLTDIGLTKIMQVSPKDSLTIKVFFTINYDGVARNGFVFTTPKEKKRVALLQIERAKKNWKVYIKLIKFYNEITDLDDSNNITIINDIAESTQVLDYYSPDVVKAQQKAVSSDRILKKFYVDEKWGLLKDADNDKRILVQPSFCDIGLFSDQEGLAPVCQDGVGIWGYIDRQGTLVIPFQYSKAGEFKKGKAKVELGMKKLTIDTTGREIR